MKRANSYIYLLAALILFSKISFSIGLPTPDRKRSERHKARIHEAFTDKKPEFNLPGRVAKIGDFSDLKISETTIPARFSQLNSSVCSLEDGDIVVVWQDKRMGSYKIYAQLYDSLGNSISDNLMLVGRTDGYDLIEPKTVCDGAGGFFLAWRDEISGGLYAARYDNSITQIVAPFSINAPATYAGPFDIDSYGNSHIVLVWEDYGPGSKISLRIFGADGTALTDTIRISEDNQTPCWTPSVALDASGAMAIVWEDYRFGNSDIYFQRVNADGSPSGSNLGVVEAIHDDSAQYLPQVAFSVRDGYAIGWLDRRLGSQQVFMRRYIPGSGLSGGSFLVSDSSTPAQNWDIAIDISSANDLALSWASIGAEDRIMLQKFTDGFSPDGDAFVANSFTPGKRRQTALNIGLSDRLFCTWTDDRLGEDDIFLELIAMDGTRLLTADLQVNDDLGGAPSYEPDIAIFNDTLAIMIFTDARDDAGDIFMQLIHSNGSLIGGNIKLNSDSTSTRQDKPALAVSASSILTVWSDARPFLGLNGTRIFGQKIEPDGLLSGEEFLIADSTNHWFKTDPAVAMKPDGAALVAWLEHQSENINVFGRFLNPDGSPSGVSFEVSSPATDINNEKLHVLHNNDKFSALWLSRDFSGGASIIIARDTNTGEFENRIIFTSPFSGITIIDFSAAIDLSGNIYLLWEGSGTQKFLYLTSIADDGTIINQGIEITTRPSEEKLEPALAFDNENLLTATWIDARNGIRQLYYQLFNMGLVSIGEGTSSMAAPEYMSQPVVATLNKNIWFGWSDPRDGGLNIYARQMFYSPTDVNSDDAPLLPSGWGLEQNFPNPFNPSTVIEFSLPTRGLVNISVFDLLGRKITTLADKVFSSGRHRLVWDGHDFHGRQVSSGVYFYKMTTGEKSQSRKMLLIK